MTRRYEYDSEFWDAYASGNESRYDAGFAGRVAYTAGALHCASVLEVGCGTGIDLRLLPRNVRACGLDPNSGAVAAARNDTPSANLAMGMITDMPFADSSVDLVFTHRLLNYLDEETLSDGMHEMYRVAAKYVMSCEWFGEREDVMDGRRRLRNMAGRWAGMDAEVVADAPIHAADHGEWEGRQADTRLTLVRVEPGGS